MSPQTLTPSWERPWGKPPPGRCGPHGTHPLVLLYVEPTGQGTGGDKDFTENSGSGTQNSRDRSPLILKPKSLQVKKGSEWS